MSDSGWGNGVNLSLPNLSVSVDSESSKAGEVGSLLYLGKFSSKLTLFEFVGWREDSLGGNIGVKFTTVVSD